MCVLNEITNYQFLYNLGVFQKIRVGGICCFCNLFTINKFFHIRFIKISNNEEMFIV